MGWLTPAEKPVLDHEALKKEVTNFSPEIPLVGQVVKIVHFTNDKGDVAKLETTVASRSSDSEWVSVRVFSLAHGDRIGTQEFKLFQWNRTSKKWFFWDMYDGKSRPAIIEF